MNAVVTLLKILIFCILIPILAGTAVSHKLLKLNKSIKVTIFTALPVGYITLWALMEVICIPATMLKLPFTTVVIIISTVMLAFSAVTVVFALKDKTWKVRLNSDISLAKSLNITDWLFILLFAAVFVYVVYKLITTFFYDEDDSRFLANAVDILKDNRILASDPITGLPINTHNYGDFRKEIVAPWAAFLALGAYVTDMHATVFAHNVYVILALIILFCLVAEIIMILTDGKKEASVIFPSLTVLLFVLMYGFYTLQGSERFIMTRVWQGKASIAGIGVAAVIFAMLLIEKQNSITDGSSKKRHLRGFILLILSNCAMCLMSSMGVVLGATMIGAYGIVLGIRHKSIKLLIFSALCCAPNVILFAVSHYYTLEVYVGG